MARKAAWPPPMKPHTSGQARVNYKGKDYYLGPYGSDEAKKNYANLLAQLAEHGSAEQVKPVSLRVCEAIEFWVNDEGKKYTGKELAHYERCIEVLIEVAGREKMADFGVADLERVRKKMVALDWCSNVINRRIVRIRTIWRWLERQGYAPRGSWEHLRTLPGIAAHDPRVRHTKRVQPAGWSDLVKVCKSVRQTVRAMLLLEWYTGARPGEICRMRPCEIDQTGDVWVYSPTSHKCAWRGQDRSVPLGPICQKILLPFLTNLKADEYLFQPATRCPRRARRYYSPESYAQVVRRAAEKAGVPGFHAYRLRHSAKQRLTRAVGLDDARSVLGQKSLGTTNEYAAGADIEQAKKAAKKHG